MLKQFTVLDAWRTWNEPAAQAAASRGYDAKIITNGEEAKGRAGLGFIRPHAAPQKERSMFDDLIMRWQPGMQMVQDRAQLEVFENKGEQFARWGRFMPQTVRLTTRDQARRFLDTVTLDATWVSKADEGASSSNIRILQGRNALRQHIDLVFRRGIRVRHCGGHATMQRNYVMLQRFVPHTVTWRVNIVGNHRAIFRRFNYKDRPVAETGNVEPVKEMTAEVASLLDYVEENLARPIDSKWVALDILRDGETWALLETSLGWPWPSPGDCDNAPFFKKVTYQGVRVPLVWASTKYLWRDMWELMLDEYEAGVFSGR